jgi:amidase
LPYVGHSAADKELLFLSALELAAKVRSGELGARELVELALERIEALDGKLNAFVELDAERAIAAAEQVAPGDERPFAGIPTAIKNNRAVEGLRLTYGAPLLEQMRAPYDCAVTRRLRDAGFIILGTTTLPEYGILPVSEAHIFGPTRNPWDLERTPGGSSGGAAAAVAAGLLPVAHGNDGGGSVRIPAACCGLVGCKPQRGRVSLAPELGHSLLVIDSMLTRTIADSAALLDVLAGPEVGDAYWAPAPEQSFAALAKRPPARARIGYTTVSPIAEASIDPLCAQAVGQAAQLLQEAGHELIEVDPPWPQEGLVERFGMLFCIHIALSIEYSGKVAGREVGAQDMEPMSYAIYSLAKGLSAIDGLALETEMLAAVRPVAELIAGYDAILTPALAERPLRIGTLDTYAEEPLSTFTRSGHFTPFTALFNASGHPAIALPLFEGADGLPLAVQLVGQPAQEGTLLALGAQLEERCGWARRRPAAVLG